MRKHISVTVRAIAVTLLLLPAGTASADLLEEVTAASDSARAIAKTALVEKDAGKIASLFTEDAAVIDENGRSIRGRFTIRATLTLLLMATGETEVEISRFDLNLIDSTGYETGKYTLRETSEDGKNRTFTGRCTLIWRFEDKGWKIDRAIGIR